MYTILMSYQIWFSWLEGKLYTLKKIVRQKFVFIELDNLALVDMVTN